MGAGRKMLEGQDEGRENDKQLGLGLDEQDPKIDEDRCEFRNYCSKGRK